MLYMTYKMLLVKCILNYDHIINICVHYNI